MSECLHITSLCVSDPPFPNWIQLTTELPEAILSFVVATGGIGPTNSVFASLIREAAKRVTEQNRIFGTVTNQQTPI